MKSITTTTGSHYDIQKKRRADHTDAPDLEGVAWPDHLLGRPEA